MTNLADQILAHRYVWCGREYKTIGGLHNAMLKTWPNTAIYFEAFTCGLHDRKSNIRYIFDVSREDGRSIIADLPQT